MNAIPGLQRPRRVPLAAAVALAVLSGCASYQPYPLEDRSPLAADIDALQVEMAEGPGKHTSRNTFNPLDGLDLTEAGIIAVVNNPDLRVRSRVTRRPG